MAQPCQQLPTPGHAEQQREKVARLAHASPGVQPTWNSSELGRNSNSECLQMDQILSVKFDRQINRENAFRQMVSPIYICKADSRVESTTCARAAIAALSSLVLPASPSGGQEGFAGAALICRPLSSSAVWYREGREPAVDRLGRRGGGRHSLQTKFTEEPFVCKIRP